MSPSHPTIPTVAGAVSRSETYSKLIHHLRECQSLAAVMSHLERTEFETDHSKAMANGWLATSELFRRLEFKIIDLAQGKLLS